MKRIHDAWFDMPSTQRVAIALIPVGLFVLLAVQQRLPWL